MKELLVILSGLVLFGCSEQSRLSSSPTLHSTPRSTPNPGSSLTPGAPGLRNLAKNLYIGAAVAAPALGTDPYTSILANEYNMAIAENVGKMRAVEPREGVFDFEAQDALVRFATIHNMKMQGGPLIWAPAIPGWINEYRGNAAELTSIMTTYITTVIRHYSTEFPGVIIAWEVVNEATTTGLGVFAAVPNCVELAFRTARAADPNVALFYNDYGDETSGGTATKVHNLVAPLKQKGLVDAVGFQSHFAIRNAPKMSAIKAAMDSLGAIGLDVYVTEFDFSLPSANGTTPDDPNDLLTQGTYYRAYLETCMATPNCKQFITWGFTDAHSWIPVFRKGSGVALPFDVNYNKKPAYYGMQDALSGAAAR